MGQCLKPSYHPSVLRGMVNIELTPLLGEWGTHGLAGTWLPWDQFSAKAAHLRVPTPEPGGPGHASPGISVLWPFSPFGRLEKQPLYPKEKGRTIRSSHWTRGMSEVPACRPTVWKFIENHEWLTTEKRTEQWESLLCTWGFGKCCLL